jgi:hypothetical protein
MAFRRFWRGEDGEGGVAMRLLQSRLHGLDQLLDMDSVRALLGRHSVAPPIANPLTPSSAAPAAGQPASGSVAVPTMFGAVAAAPLTAEVALPFATSFLDPQASFLDPHSGAEYVVLYQPDGGLALGNALIIDAGKREILSDWSEARPDPTSGGSDQLVFGGGMSGSLGGFAAGHEQIVFLGGSDYALSATDGDVAAGGLMSVIGSHLGGADSLDFDGSAEKDGAFDMFGGAGADRLTGGGGNDDFDGGHGGDRLTGGGGSDIFHYSGAADSTGAGYDTLVGFEYGADKIDLPGAVTGFDSRLSEGALSQGSFDSDLAAAFGPGKLGAGHAAWFTPNGGDLAGQTFLIVDGNGVAGYQAGEDYVFHMAEPPPPDLSGIAFFV